MSENLLRPLERTILRLRSEGMTSPEIGRRVGKRPGTVDRIILMIDYKKSLQQRRESSGQRLTPLERVVARRLASGENHGEVASRLGRSGAHIRRIESYIAIKDA